MRASLDRAGVANAKYRLAYTWSEVLDGAAELGYPLIIKPVDLGSSSFVRVVHDEDALHDAFNALENFPLNYRGRNEITPYCWKSFCREKKLALNVSHTRERLRRLDRQINL